MLHCFLAGRARHCAEANSSEEVQWRGQGAQGWLQSSVIMEKEKKEQEEGIEKEEQEESRCNRKKNYKKEQKSLQQEQDC